MIIFLDTGPLGVITNPKRPTIAIDALRWAADHVRAGNRIMTPSIADYEVRRELVRLGKTASITSLNAWNTTPFDRYIVLTDSALRLASNLWAMSRNRGMTTADSKELDCDVLIAAQALDYQAANGLNSADIIVATMNIGHLAQFISADLWQNIKP